MSLPTKREKERGQKRQTRRLVNREADAIDRIDTLLWELRVASGYRAAQRVLFYIMLVHWSPLAKRVSVEELSNG